MSIGSKCVAERIEIALTLVGTNQEVKYRSVVPDGETPRRPKCRHILLQERNRVCPCAEARSQLLPPYRLIAEHRATFSYVERAITSAELKEFLRP